MRHSSHPPAWYRDPRDGTRIRRWNGRAWTDEVRPVPDWLRTLRLSPGPPARVRRSGARLWAVTAALLSLAAAVTAFLVTGAGDDDRLSDARFLAMADQRCAATEQSVVTPNRASRGATREADRIDALATGWERMVVDLRGIPLADDVGDGPKVDRWLRAWDRWTELGHRYADALRSEDRAAAAAILRRSEVENAVMTRFALVNGIDSCLFPNR